MDLIKNMIRQIRDVFAGLSMTKKIIVGVVAATVVVAFAVLFTVSGQEPKVVLFADLSAEDFGQVTKKLDELSFQYSTTGTTSIYVEPEQREQIMTRLAQEDMIPKGIPGWKLFDMTNWTETDRELDVKYMRALQGAIVSHIQSLEPVEKAEVQIAMTEDSLYANQNSEYTAAVTIHLAPGYDSLNQKTIKGIVYLVSRAVGPRLKPENVTVTDASGSIISDFDDELSKSKEQMTILEERRKHKEKERVRMLNDIKAGLERVFTAERIQVVSLNLEYNWDEITEHKKEHTPIETVSDNPDTPYSERQFVESFTLSEKKTEENFQGHGWNPEGPAGTEANTPPGYKAADDQFAKYNKNENITNYAINEVQTDIKRDPFDIQKITVAIAIDSLQDLPRKEDGNYDLDPAKKPVQTPLSPEELKQAEEIVKAAIGFKAARGDMVSVANIPFDHSKQWDALRNEYIRKEQTKRLLLAGLIGIFALFLGFVLYQAIRKELARRRRIREEQLALEQQRMREAALRAAEEEGVDVELSLEDRARLELQQNAINLARERPDDVAQLLRTWLAEE